MKTPLPLTLILTDQAVESTGWVLQWSATEMPVMWEGKVTLSGVIDIPRPLARLISETIFGLVWEAHKPQRVGMIGAGLEMLTTRGAVAPPGRSQ